MKRIQLLVAALAAFVTPLGPGYCQGTVTGRSSVSYPTTSTYLYGRVHSWIPVEVDTDGWVTIAGAAASTRYSIETTLQCGVSGWTDYLDTPVWFYLTTDANGNATVDPLDYADEDDTGNVGVEPGVNAYEAFGMTQVIGSNGLTVGSPNPYVTDVSFTIAGDD